MGRSMAQAVEERARERFLAEGLALGEPRGLRHALEKVLAARFGPVPPEVAAVVAGADAERLDRWLDRAGVAETLEEVEITDSSPAR